MRKCFIGLIFFVVALLAGCTHLKETQPVSNHQFRASTVAADSITKHLPNYTGQLKTVKGKGKAIVSGPKDHKRVTLYFSSNRRKSLITAKNGLGIEGGKLLTTGDSLLIYNKVDDYARKISLKNQPLQDINNLASVNILNILNVTAVADHVKNVRENATLYMLQMQSGRRLYVDKKTNCVQQINQPPGSAEPYSQIIYAAYKKIDGMMLPRRITIFSKNRASKVDLLIQSLQINPKLGTLTIHLPDDIKIYH